MADQEDQHDFDDFDTLTEPSVSADMDEDLSFGKPDTSRKKRQAIFYLALVVILVLGVTSAWFLFLRQPDQQQPVIDASAPKAPTPVIAEGETPPPQAGNAPKSALPPGVMSPQDLANANNLTGAKPAVPGAATIVPVDPNSVNPEVATPQVASPEVAAVEKTAAPGATVSSTGTTVEALPPPIAPNATGTTPPVSVGSAMPDAVPNAPVAPNKANVTSAIPEAPAAPGMVTPANAPAMATPATPVTPDVMPPANVVAQPAMAPNVVPSAVPNAPAITPVAPVAVIPANNPAATAAIAENTELKQQVKDLTDKLDAANQQMQVLQQQAAAAAVAPVKEEAPAPKSEAKPAKKKAVKKAVKKKVAKKSSSESMSSSSSTSSWELRSAQPGVAWLGKLGSEEMTRYTIGQSVPGLGVVQDVTQEGGRWIVKTSGGTLRQ
jgi:hypothetical protein